MDAVREWEAMGTRIDVLGHRIFVIDHSPRTTPHGCILVLHGFPSCSFDYRAVLPALAAEHRVVLIDLLGYGLSDKPHDRPYSLFEQADIVEACVKTLGIDSVKLLTHDMGDSVGGELLARALDGGLGFEVTARAITNGSIYMDLVQLSVGQQWMLALPDAALPDDQAPNEDLFAASLAATFAPATQPSADEVRAQWLLVSRGDGHRILPRLIRYVEERRVHEGRWTGAVERHPSPLDIIWGDLDPIAVWPMAQRLADRNRFARLVRLEGVGHYPMIETPDRFVETLASFLSAG
ncbi:MAG TPA: alpha/beta hydrolase [Actinomycetota bacterium]|nr:alpha/beta hydrolase [Actinomycetota bacterium]